MRLVRIFFGLLCLTSSLCASDIIVEVTISFGSERSSWVPTGNTLESSISELNDIVRKNGGQNFSNLNKEIERIEEKERILKQIEEEKERIIIEQKKIDEAKKEEERAKKEEERIAKIKKEFCPYPIGSNVVIQLIYGSIVEGTLKKISKDSITIIDIDKQMEMTLYKQVLSLETAKCFYYSTNDWKNYKYP